MNARQTARTTAPYSDVTEIDGDAEPAHGRVSMSEGWANACRRLRANVGDAVYNAWFARQIGRAHV